MWWRWQQNCTWRCHLGCNLGGNMAGNTPVVKVCRKLYTSRHTWTRTLDFRTSWPEGTLCHQGRAYEEDTAGCEGPHHEILMQADCSGGQSSPCAVAPRGMKEGYVKYKWSSSLVLWRYYRINSLLRQVWPSSVEFVRFSFQRFYREPSKCVMAQQTDNFIHSFIHSFINGCAALYWAHTSSSVS
jgi:hypothetical protein